MARIKMCDTDRENFGGPEWLPFRLTEMIDDTDVGELERLEKLTGVPFADAVEELTSARAIRLWLWLGLRAEGVDVAWKDFRPKVLKAVLDTDGGGVAPPDGAAPSTDPSESS